MLFSSQLEYLNRSSKISTPAHNKINNKQEALLNASNLNYTPSFSFYLNSRINEQMVRTNIHELATVSSERLEIMSNNIKNISNSRDAHSDTNLLVTTQVDKSKLRNNRHRLG